MGHLLRADPHPGHALEAGDDIVVEVVVGHGGNVVKPYQLVLLRQVDNGGVVAGALPGSSGFVLSCLVPVGTLSKG